MKKNGCAVLAAVFLIAVLASCGTGLNAPQTSSAGGSGQASQVSEPDSSQTGGSQKDGAQTGATQKDSNQTDIARTGGGQTGASPSAGIPESGLVLLDEADLKVTATGISDGLLGPEIALDFENGTDQPLTFSAKRASVNGYMMNLLLIAEVAAGKKSSETLDLMDTDLARCGIDTVAEIELELNVYNSDTYDDYFNSDVIRIKLADDHRQAFDDSGTVLSDTGGVKVISKGLSDEAALLGYEWLLYIENQSDQTVYVSLDDVSVNGSMIDVYYGQEITPGKCSLRPVCFSVSDLEQNGIDRIEKVELVIKGDNLETWETVFRTDPIAVSFN